MGPINKIICKNENEIGDLASKIIVDLVNNKRKSNLGHATGSSPLGP